MHLIKVKLHRNASGIAFRLFSDKNSKSVAGKEVKTPSDALPVASPEVCSVSEALPGASSKDRPNPEDHRHPYKVAKSFDKIPGPLSLPFIGTIWSYYWPFNIYSFKTLHLTYEKMYYAYGPIVRERQWPNRTLLHLFNVEDFHKVYEDGGNQPIRMSHQALGKYRRERPIDYLSEGLLSSNDGEWETFRKMFDKTFMRGHKQEVRSVIEDTVDELLSTLNFRLDGKSELDVMPLFYRWGLESIVRILFHKGIGALQFNSSPDTYTLIETAGKTHHATYMTENHVYNTKQYHEMLRKAQDSFSKIVFRLMNECLNNPYEPEYQNCFAVNLLRENPGMDRRDLFTMMVDSVLGGIDNTSCAVTMTLYHLSLNKRVQDKLREETRENMPTKDVRFTKLSKHKNEYLDAVIKESLRLTPPSLANGRITRKDMVLSGFMVPAGTACILQHQVASNLEKYHSDATSFIPERHLERNRQALMAKLVPVSNPFGTRFRSCIGRHIAEEELNILVSKIIRNYELSYHHEDVGFVTLLMSKPDKPVRLHFKEIHD